MALIARGPSSEVEQDPGRGGPRRPSVGPTTDSEKPSVLHLGVVVVDPGYLELQASQLFSPRPTESSETDDHDPETPRNPPRSSAIRRRESWIRLANDRRAVVTCGDRLGSPSVRR
jgi:hypothetical protein